MLRRLWLLFAQAVTVGLALLFVISTLRPEWLRRPSPPPAATTVTTRANALGSYAEAASRATPAVVSIYTTKDISRTSSGWVDDPLLDRFFGERARPLPERIVSLGSGVIATADGYILTNNHVVQAADEISVALADGRRFEAKLVGTDPESDLALLRIDAPNLPTITFGRSDNLTVGDVVLAIGNPFDVGLTVTMGIVSALDRNNLGINRYENFIQTDAAINQGNSGGALVDSNGHLVGINTAIYSRTGGSVGIGFAIPVSMVEQNLEQLAKKGKVVRGYFGIEPMDITPDMVKTLNLGREHGVIVKRVISSGPAGKAGVEPEDIVLTIEGSAVHDTRGMLDQIARLAPGSTARVIVLRNNKEVEIPVSVGERPSAQPRR